MTLALTPFRLALAETYSTGLNLRPVPLRCPRFIPRDHRGIWVTSGAG